MKRIAVASSIILLVLGLAAAACGGYQGEGRAQQSLAPTTTREPSPTGEGAALKMTLLDFSFDPGTLAVDPGRSVTVELVNSGAAPHTFTISELNVDQTLQPGQRGTVTFTPGRSGNLVFFCRFHRSRGMEGTLRVGQGGSGFAPQGTTPAPDGAQAGYPY